MHQMYFLCENAEMRTTRVSKLNRDFVDASNISKTDMNNSRIYALRKLLPIFKRSRRSLSTLKNASINARDDNGTKLRDPFRSILDQWRTARSEFCWIEVRVPRDSPHPNRIRTDQLSNLNASEFWSSLQQTTSDDSAKNGDGFAREEQCSDEHHEALKFAFPKKVKARGRRKATPSKRRVTFADH